MIRERARDRASGADGARESGGAGAAEFARPIGADSNELRLYLRRWWTLEFRRPHLRVADSFLATALATAGLIGAVAVAVTASIFLVVGLSSLFARWMVGGIPELIGSACGWGLSFGLVLFLRAGVKRNSVRRAARRLAEAESIDCAEPSSHLAPPQRPAGVRP